MSKCWSGAARFHERPSGGPSSAGTPPPPQISRPISRTVTCEKRTRDTLGSESPLEAEAPPEEHEADAPCLRFGGVRTGGGDDDDMREIRAGLELNLALCCRERGPDDGSARANPGAGALRHFLSASHAWDTWPVVS